MFEWDEAKNRANIAKHGVSFAEAVRVFDGAVLTGLDDILEHGEERWISIGAIGLNTFLVVIHTDRYGVARIISARRATRKERELYLAEIQP